MPEQASTCSFESRAPLCAAAVHRRHRRALLVRRLRRSRRLPSLGSMADARTPAARSYRPRALRSKAPVDGVGGGPTRLAAAWHGDRGARASPPCSRSAEQLSAWRDATATGPDRTATVSSPGCWSARASSTLCTGGASAGGGGNNLYAMQKPAMRGDRRVHVAAWRAAYRGRFPTTSRHAQR